VVSTFCDTQGDSVEVYTAAAEAILPPETAAFYKAMVEALRAADLPFLVGGAYAFARYTGIERHTKDFDVFVREEDVDQAMTALAAAGCATELTFPHWLGKAYCGADFIDVIFSSGNGLVEVDEEWFANAVEDEVLGLPVRLVPPEEMLWSKAFVMERERYDGADVNHLLRARAAELDWSRLLQRFGEHWPVLLSHLVLFAYVYPAEASNVPDWVVRGLLERAPTVFHSAAVADRICRGPLVSRAQYLTDIEAWGYHDPRLHRHGGSMTRAEVDDWTEAIERDG
jgi:hypothetical protein